MGSGRLTIASVGCNAPEACNGLKMSKVWASGLLTILLFATSLVSSFNLEVRYPIIKVGRGQAYFGYSVAQHRTLRTREFGEAVILVGAPKDDNLQPNTTESGALWQCPLSTEWLQQQQRQRCRSQHRIEERYMAVRQSRQPFQ